MTQNILSISGLAITGRADRQKALSVGGLVVAHRRDFCMALSAGALVVLAPPAEIDTYVRQHVVATGARQTFTVPDGCTTLVARLWGAGGGAGAGMSARNTLYSGGGAFLEVSIPVIPGQNIAVDVGMGGSGANPRRRLPGAHGWPLTGLASVDAKHDCFGGGLGGPTRIYRNGVLMAEAAGGAHSRGFPSGGSDIPSEAGEAFADCTVIQSIPASGHVCGGPSVEGRAARDGWGVHNPGPSQDIRAPGHNGCAYLMWAVG